MVHPDSHRVSRALWYLGTALELSFISPTGVSPSVPGLSRPLSYELESRIERPTTPEIHVSLV
jgi:hypothetical protein